MTREEARQLLQDGNVRERLSAARALADLAEPEDRLFLRRAEQNEPDRYVRSALRRALGSLAAPPLAPPEPAEPLDRAAIVRNLTDRITHEFASPVGTLRYHAEREVADFEKSETRKELDRVDAVIAAIRQLSDAATPPNLEEIHVDTFVAGVVADFLIRRPEAEIEREGPANIAVANAGLLTLILRNALSNATDAQGAAETLAKPIIVTWGSDNRMNWICVLDHGLGVSEDIEDLAQIGVSSKKGHSGMGLAIAREAAWSLRGDISLDNRRDEGCRFRFEWPRDLEA